MPPKLPHRPSESFESPVKKTRVPEIAPTPAATPLRSRLPQSSFAQGSADSAHSSSLLPRFLTSPNIQHPAKSSSELNIFKRICEYELYKTDFSGKLQLKYLSSIGRSDAIDPKISKSKTSLDYEIYPIAKLEQLIQKSKIEKLNGMFVRTIRYVVTLKGEIRFGEEGDALKSSKFARHNQLTVSNVSEISIASDLIQISPNSVLAAGMLDFHPEKFCVDGGNNLSGCYGQEGSVGAMKWMIKILRMFNVPFAETFKLSEYGKRNIYEEITTVDIDCWLRDDAISHHHNWLFEANSIHADVIHIVKNAPERQGTAQKFSIKRQPFDLNFYKEEPLQGSPFQGKENMALNPNFQESQDVLGLRWRERDFGANKMELTFPFQAGKSSYFDSRTDHMSGVLSSSSSSSNKRRSLLSGGDDDTVGALSEARFFGSPTRAREASSADSPVLSDKGICDRFDDSSSLRTPPRKRRAGAAEECRSPVESLFG
jgi:hypothetical protein